MTYSGTFPIMEFNKWFFNVLFEKGENLKFGNKVTDVALRLADTEKYWNMGANLEIVFISNILAIMKEI